MKALVLALLALAAARCLPAQGTYVDSEGRAHAWRPDSEGRLRWEGRPYVPVGGMFCFRYLTEYDSKDVSRMEWLFQDDLKILERIRGAGIRHLYVNPVGAATGRPAAVWNRCAAELERQGFSYGIELTDGPRRGMQGWLSSSDAWSARVHGGRLELELREEFGALPELDRLLAVGRDGSVSEVPVEPSSLSTWSLSLPPSALATGTVFVPLIRAPRGFNVSDLWDGYGEYEARLSAWARGLRFGAGFRFVVDPLTNEMNYYGYTSRMVPSSPGFVSGFAGWLEHRYGGNLRALARAWRLGWAPAGWGECARLIPVSKDEQDKSSTYGGAGRRGWLLDPVARVSRPADARSSRVLEDLRGWRDESVAGYCRRVAQAVHRSVGDVPVLFKHTGRFERFLVQRDGDRGIDGIGIEAWGHDEGELARTAGPPLAVLLNWDRPGWLPVTESAPSPVSLGKTPGYPNREAMFAHLDALLELGARGFYLFALRPLPEDLLADFCLYRDARQLGWLADYEKELARTPRASRLLRRPAIRFHKLEAGPGLRVRGWKTGELPPTPLSELKGGTLTLPRLPAR